MLPVDKLLFIVYAPGAGGRILNVCVSTSNSVANWIVGDLPDPVEYVQKKFCNPIKDKHLGTEPHPPYRMTWFTRQLPFTRGDDLTVEQACKYLLDDNIIAEEISNNRLISIPYTKPYLPNWYTSKTIALVNDHDSNAWIQQRRREVLYKVENKIVYKLRFLADFINPVNKPLVHLYTDHPESEFPVEQLDKKLIEDFEKEKVSAKFDININISDFLTCDPDILWDTVYPIVGNVNRQWATPALLEWRKYWI